MPRFFRRSRSGSESYPRSAITRSGFCRGRPLGRGTWTCWSVASASVTSPGEALSSRTPSGTPSPSTNTIHFVPLPRLVLPTASPPFSQPRSCRPRTSRPSARVPLHPATPTEPARHSATRLALPTAATAASRLREKETHWARTATLPRFAKSIECLQNTPGLGPTVARACPAAAWARGIDI